MRDFKDQLKHMGEWLTKSRDDKTILSVCLPHSQDFLVRGGSVGADRRVTLIVDFVIQGLRLQRE